MQLWNYTNLTNENKPFIKCNFIWQKWALIT